MSRPVVARPPHRRNPLFPLALALALGAITAPFAPGPFVPSSGVHAAGPPGLPPCDATELLRAATVTDIGVTTSIVGFALGDLDGDGDLDGIYGVNTSTVNNHWVRRVRNEGDGTFTPLGILPVPHRMSAIGVHDVNGDGRDDLVLSVSDTSDEVSGIDVLLSETDGSFASPVTYPYELLESGNQDLAFGDVDGDGDIDIADRSPARRVRILVNDGTGTFAAPGGWLPLDPVYALALGDVDGDGRDDLAAATLPGGSGGEVRILLQDPPRTEITILADALVQSVAVEDLDGDALAEVVFGLWDPFAENPADRLTIRLGATGALQTVPVDDGPRPGIAGSRSIQVGDLDGDGRLDLASWGRALSVPYGAADGGFELPIVYGLEPEGFTPVLGDVDGDGRSDVVFLSPGYSSAVLGSVRVVSGAPDRRAHATMRRSVGRQARFIVTADIDGDGDVDAIVGESGANATGPWVVPNEGGLRFGSPLAIGDLSVNDLLASDLDADGDIDIAAATKGIGIYRNVGSGFFFGGVNLSTGVSMRSVAAADLDDDGLVDLLAADIETAGVLVFPGTAPHQWQPDPVVSAAPSRPQDLATGDVDGDGVLDVVAGLQSGASAAFSVHLGLGDGTLAAGIGVPGSSAEQVRLADFDGDGDLDVLAGRNGFLFLFANDGTGSYPDPPVVLPFRGRLPAVGDIDLDGDLDLAVADGLESFEPQIVIARNDGSADFNDFVSAPGVEGIVGTAIADKDLDGAPDVFTAGGFHVAVHLSRISCRADLDADGVVGMNDVMILTTSFGPCGGCPEDLDCDGQIGFGDLVAVLTSWGDCPFVN